MGRLWSASDRGPRDGGRVHPGAAWSAILAGEVDAGHEVASALSSAHHAGIDSIEHQLGSTEHLEVVVWADLPPRQVDESVTAFALNRRAAKIELAVSLDHIEVEFPARFVRISEDELGRNTTELDSDVNVAHRRSVGSAEHAAGKVGADDGDSHDLQYPARTRRDHLPVFGGGVVP